MTIRELVITPKRVANGLITIEATLNDRVVACDSINIENQNDRSRYAQAVHNAVPAVPVTVIEEKLLTIDCRLPALLEKNWPEPLDIDQPILPTFPVSALPEPLGPWVSATAEATQTPADLAGLLGLAACAGAAARRVEIKLSPSWSEPINLFVASLLEPGNRKSAVFSAALNPLRTIESELVENSMPDHARAVSELRTRETQLKELERKAAKGDLDASQAAGDLAANLALERVPTLPKLIVDDATAEAIETLLANHDGRLVVAGCEGGLFDVMAGRYASGAANFDCFLKGHAGDSLRVDRVTRGSIVVDRCCLTLAYAVQPDVMRGLAQRPSFRGRGLIGRFMYALPKTTLGTRSINPRSVPGPVAFEYEHCIRRLSRILSPKTARVYYRFRRRHSIVSTVGKRK